MRRRTRKSRWRLSAKVNGELYRRFKDSAESRGLELGELVCYLTYLGLEAPEQALWQKVERTLGEPREDPADTKEGAQAPRPLGMVA